MTYLFLRAITMLCTTKKRHSIAAIVIPSQEYFDDDIDSMKSANCNENDTQSKEFSENKKSSESESNKIHTDEEFDSYFKK